MSTKTSCFITSYDVLKIVAVALMIIDHIGFYFFPDEMWWRVIGRLCVPIWCFLIGYARSRELSLGLWAGVFILVIANIISGGPIFPVTILLTFLIIRAVIDHAAQWGLKSKESIIIMAFALTLIYWPSMMVVEYGSAALVLALGGYAIRERHVNAKPIWIGAICLYFLSQIVVFEFSLIHVMAFGVGLIPISWALLRFEPMQFTAYAANMFVQWGGRHTLEIYVAHLVLFKLISAYFALNDYGWFAPIRYW